MVSDGICLIQTHSLSYPNSRDAIASKNSFPPYFMVLVSTIGTLDDMLMMRSFYPMNGLFNTKVAPVLNINLCQLKFL